MASEKKQITRNRTSYSCRMCRRRKVRCDKKHPRCGGCIKADETCIYGDADTTGGNLPLQSTLTGNIPLRKRRAIDDGYDDTHSDGSDRNIFPTLQSIQQKLSQLTSLVLDINRLTPRSTSSSRNDHGPDSVSAPSHDSGTGAKSPDLESQNDTNRTLLSINADGSKLSWENVLGNLQQLNELFNIGNRAANGLEIPKPEGNAPQPPASRADLLRPMMNKDMLAPTECEFAVLFRSWLWSVYPILPMISPHLVLTKYRAFRHWYTHGLDRGEPNPDPGFMPFLVMIWLTGYEGLSEQAKRVWFPWALDNSWWNRGLHAWLETELEAANMEVHPSIFALAAAVTFQYLGMGGQGTVKNHVRNTLNLRTAQSLGIHNERTLKDLSVTQAEMRRRIWWEALSMDTSIATVTGMPVILDERYTDIKMISELKESSLITPEAQEYEMHLQETGASPDRPDDPANCQTSSFVSVHHLVARARHIMTTATNYVLKANMSARPMTLDELKAVRRSVHKAGDEVRGIINRIPTRGIPELDFVPETKVYSGVDHLDIMGEEITSDELDYFLRDKAISMVTSPIMKHHRATTTAFHKWARVMLSMTIDRLECITYAPFLKKSKSRLWAVARNCALRSCHAYMRKFLRLAEDPELREFRWTWTGTLHPMHATIIMLVDVHDRPHSDEAPRSRALIDRMFSLMCMPKFLDFSQFGPTNILPLKEGGEEAWTMLRKLRHKAWQNAGLDPDVLWTEEDQISIGIGKALNENDLFIRSLREDIILNRKEREGQGNVLLSIRLAFETLRKQRLHPSDAGQGDQITGSVVREVEDLDNFSVIPQILLSRARSDQELMPYPATSSTREVTSDRKGGMPDPLHETSKQSSGDVPIVNIGDLIRKIQQTKPAEGLENAVPAHDQGPSLSSNPLKSRNELPDAPQYDFRTLKSLESAAYKDVSEGHANIAVPSHVPDTIEHQGAFAYFPTASAQFVKDRIDSTNANMTQTGVQHVIRENTKAQPLMTLDASASPLGNSPFDPSIDGHASNSAASKVAQITFADREYRQGEALDLHSQQVNHSPKIEQGLPETFNPVGDNRNDTANDMDMEFDWDRWDEMFGQFAGVGDMLMEVYELEDSEHQ